VADVLFTPQEIGLPRKFREWRENQAEALEQATTDLEEKRFVAYNAPTGTGKSILYVALAKMMGWRTLILTRTKGLQKQLMDDFEEVGLTDIRGRSNYPCHMASHMTCEDGAHAGCLHNKGQNQGAMLRDKCPYREARQAAMAAKLVITNYSYWPLINWYGEGLGQFDLIVLDESHEAPQAVCEVMSVTLSAREVYRMLDSRWPDNADDAGIDTWSGWARAMMPRTARAAESLKQEVQDQGGTASERLLKEAAHWRSLLSKLGTIAGAEGPWASEQTRISEATGYRLEPLWPAQYAERALFRGIPRVLFVSATVQEKTLSLMGLKEDDYIFREWPWIFPVNRSPIYWLDTVSVGAKMSAEDEAVLFNQIDSLLASRGDRKAIIQSVSYKLKDKILAASVYANRMIAHEQNSVSTAAAVQRFKLSSPPAVLVSPSISTGYDFPYCVDPDAKVLTADLRWVPAGSVRIGDELGAFEEKAQDCRRSRLWVKSMVTAAQNKILSRYRLVFEDGTEVICSEGHKWLTYHGEEKRWVITSDLRCGPVYSRVCRVIDTWKTRSDYSAGYLAAAFDGEGSLSRYFNTSDRRGPHSGELSSASLNFTQNHNPMLDQVLAMLVENGYHVSLYSKSKSDMLHGNCTVAHLTRRTEIAKFLGEFRPARLLPKWNWDHMGSLRSKPLRLIAKVFLGDGPVRAISTDSHTLVVEGIASHNSECELNIIPKLPFPIVKSSRIMEARCRKDKGGDPEYADYLMVQDLVQACGRSMRAPDDHSETFLLDNNFRWVKYQCRKQFPGWFWRLYHKRVSAPSAPPILSTNNR